MSRALELLDMTPVQIFGRGRAGGGDKKGEVGIEIECEGHNLLLDPSKWWKGIADGSLRGESIEYILRAPIDRAKVLESLNLLSKELAQHGSKVDESYRTSVHVHLNAQPMKMRHVFNQICLYLILEDILVEYCGKERIGNVFCLRASDAEGMIDRIRRAIKKGEYANIGQDGMRYAAINTKALADHGSLEFRAFRGTVDPKLINQWVEILLEIKDAAMKYDNPQQICVDFSVLGPKAFVEKVFTANNQRAILAYPNFEKRLFDGVRLAQDIAYSIPDWTPVKIELEADQMQVYQEVMRPARRGAIQPPAGPGWVVNVGGAGGDGGIVGARVDGLDRAWMMPRPIAPGGRDFDRMIIDDDDAPDFDDAPDRHDDDEDDDF